MHLPICQLMPLAVTVATAPSPTTSNRNSTPTGSSSGMPSVILDYSTIVAAAGNESLGYYKHQNIRFASVPTGDLRWAQPQWPGVETTVNDGSLGDADIDCESQEDCLYMDVWAPANSAGKNLPVMVWTYRGGFTGGSKSQNTPEGLFNLTTDFIFVAYNYRLGITGIANGVTLNHEGGTSNVGLWDVQHAFQWTKKYISAFGGAGHEHAETFWQNVSTVVVCDGGSTNPTSTKPLQLHRPRHHNPRTMEANGQAYSGADTTADVSTYLKIFFPSITDNVVDEVLTLYPEDDYASPGLRFADMKQSFDLTAHNLALTQALGNETWNAMVALDAATLWSQDKMT
ncbi:Alpha/Beta hydrolase protein [Amylocarpus encephaloides]|uniref:Alpha/Beta hydrolase protein n=1 Tax=Amylocarpus encephaloides TaxID=45428 RepID=A0A9P7YUZ8_9HELO|nr:Alpha/Beta hydrolase protein [Amylocarpus encephaloides]